MNPTSAGVTIPDEVNKTFEMELRKAAYFGAKSRTRTLKMKMGKSGVDIAFEDYITMLDKQKDMV